MKLGPFFYLSLKSKCRRLAVRLFRLAPHAFGRATDLAEQKGRSHVRRQ